MILIRILLLAFNAAAVTYLVYRILQIYKSDGKQKGLKIATGIFLLLLPVTMVFGFIKPTMAYLILYPVAISLHLYLVRNT